MIAVDSHGSGTSTPPVTGKYGSVAAPGTWRPDEDLPSPCGAGQGLGVCLNLPRGRGTGPFGKWRPSSSVPHDAQTAIVSPNMNRPYSSCRATNQRNRRSRPVKVNATRSVERCRTLIETRLCATNHHRHGRPGRCDGTSRTMDRISAGGGHVMTVCCHLNIACSTTNHGGRGDITSQTLKTLSS